MKRTLMLGAAWICFALGAVGVVVPVLPTTPFLLVAVFLFGKSSPRWHAWLCSTGIYQRYVIAFRQDGGLSPARKAKALGISLAALAVSALLVQKPTVWVILSCCALFLCYLILVRIPTARPRRGELAPEAE